METVRLLQITDSHCFSSNGTRLPWTSAPIYPNLSLRAILDRLKRDSANFSALVFTGDIAQEETAETYQKISGMFSAFPLPVYALPGNHDAPKVMELNFKSGIAQVPFANFGKWGLFFRYP